MADEQPSEKRSEPRILADFMVEIYQRDGRTLTGIARLVNLSVAGACIDSTTGLAEKANLTLRLLLGKRHLLTLPAEVVWKRSRQHTVEYGLKFGSYPESAKSLIIKVVREYFGQEEGMDFLSLPQQ
jgi:hypothetical protein